MLKLRSRCSVAGATMHFVDIAANLTDAMYNGLYNDRAVHSPDLGVVLDRANAAGVIRTVVTAGTLEQSREALRLARSRGNLFSTVGIHPTRAREFNGRIDHVVQELLDIVESAKEKVVAIGELGLDYDRLHFSSVAEQKPAFEAQFVLAEKTGLPLFLHDRNTRGDFAAIIRANRQRFSTGVVHSFTGTLDEMREYIAQDLYIGLNGCSLKTKDNIDVAKLVPLDRLMLETDCPYWYVTIFQSTGPFHCTASRDRTLTELEILAPFRNQWDKIYSYRFQFNSERLVDEGQEKLVIGLDCER
jgi:TatD DNase family protein